MMNFLSFTSLFSMSGSIPKPDSGVAALNLGIDDTFRAYQGCTRQIEGLCMDKIDSFAAEQREPENRI